MPRNAALPTAPLAYFWGEDAFEIDRAIRSFGKQLSDARGEPLDVWRSPAADDDTSADPAGEPAGGGAAKRRARVLDEATLRIATAPMFGAGTLVVIRQPGSITREKAAEQRLVDLVGSVPPGNALVFSDLVASGGKKASAERVMTAVVDAGGTHRQFPSLTRQRMEGWIEDRARELSVEMQPGAARLLAERVGAFASGNDVDRRMMSAVAFAELEKLATYRPDGTVTRADVADLVAEAIPHSTWTFIDAVAARQAGEAALLAERLIADGVALPVVVASLHRRIRELISVRDHLDGGGRPGELVQILKMQPFVAEKRVEDARRWWIDELVAALEGLLDLDLQSKGISRDGSTVQMSDARDALELQVWVADHAGGRRGR